ncbi:MAG TPA: 30S ribosomal protein S16 [Candidatus Limnocylindria bacterium]|nr:30S ribosomal protein S16 [Candidatus Limnocylindria bacterium]
MAVRIRLSRVGATKRPSYRVVAIDSRRPRDGRALEILGFYDPLTTPATVQINADRLAAWVSKGALPSDTVARLIKINGSAPSADAPPAAERPTPPKPKRSRKAAAAAQAKEAPAPQKEAPAQEAAADEAPADEAAAATEAAPAAEAVTEEAAPAAEAVTEEAAE